MNTHTAPADTYIEDAAYMTLRATLAERIVVPRDRSCLCDAETFVSELLGDAGIWPRSVLADADCA
ncbi:hypothetical protein AL036_16410 [Salipiger aestuarii]|uniref:hypothetical protein n=1 Tax=Salipiger aestuarii TaxID=568098 RepID=UPI00123B1DCE|nr:hypothetical protein [Salipiger aestuarii]KAA8606028.1 hypothetical protein AL036_16410 [Salipiger aestuarii]